MRKRIGITLVAAVLALGVSLAASGTAGAVSSHAITVTPSTGLADGQTVTVSGTGFVEKPLVNDWAVVQCDPGILTDTSLQNALVHCDVTTQPFVFAHADASGNLSIPYTVRKTFQVEGSNTVTCGQAPNDCAIFVAQVTDQGFVGAATPISFGPQTIAQCYRDFARDQQHGLRYRLTHLLACVLQVIHHHAS